MAILPAYSRPTVMSRKTTGLVAASARAPASASASTATLSPALGGMGMSRAGLVTFVELETKVREIFYNHGEGPNWAFS